jgi:hypothetical protein
MLIFAIYNDKMMPEGGEPSRKWEGARQKVSILCYLNNSMQILKMQFGTNWQGDL